MLTNMNQHAADEAQTNTKIRRSALVVSILLGLAVVALVARNTTATSVGSPVLTKNMAEGRSSRVEKDAIAVLKDGLESRLRAKKECLKKKAMRRRRRLSWQAYVDTQLIATGQVEEAGIFSKADGSVWAASPGFALRSYKAQSVGPDGVTPVTLNVNEAKNLVSAAATGKFGPQGCRINGVKYMVVRSDPSTGPTFYGKRPNGGICITVTNQCIIVGTYNQKKNQTPGGDNAAVENLGNYLRDSGYLELMEDDSDC